MNSEDTRNLFLAIALSVLVMAGWQYFYAGPMSQRQHQAQSRRRPRRTSRRRRPNSRRRPRSRSRRASPRPAAHSAPGVVATETVAEALEANPRVAIDTPSLEGSIDLKGGKLDDLLLKNYHETIDKTSPLVRLFSPSGAPDAYWATAGYIGAAPAPSRRPRWTPSGPPTKRR